jgi:phosphoadenosine phosphosulfate reductase
MGGANALAGGGGESGFRVNTPVVQSLGRLPTADEIARASAELRTRSPGEIVRWAIDRAGGRAVVSTNFRPYEAVILHLCVEAQADIPVLWVDHGYNRSATYRHAEELRSLLHLNLKPYLPRHRDAIDGPLPGPDDEEGLRRFSAEMKLEPFHRGMRELAPTVWITALRRVQSPGRAGLDVVAGETDLGLLKVNPVFYWDDAEMEAYLREHHLPNEWDYFDPAKNGEKRECGLHAAWGREATLR